MTVRLRRAGRRPSPFARPQGPARLLMQAAVAAALIGAIAALAAIAAGNLQRQGIATGYDFLGRQARFEISESLIAYSAADSYGRALVVGFLNTLKVAVPAIVLASLLGVFVGIARLSRNPLLAGVAATYVEALRNVPLLLQLSLWYGVVTISLPQPRAALNPVRGVFLSNRGVTLPSVSAADALPVLAGLAVALLLGAGLGRWAAGRQNATGRSPRVWPLALLVFIVLPPAAWFLSGAPGLVEIPELRGFNFAGGARISPEYLALLLGLAVYSSAFIAETVRAGILAVGRGQIEAAMAVGLRPLRRLRLIVLPQAFRLIIPPATSQYLNLVKNSSLGVAIAYPDLILVGNITMNNTGQAIEVVSVFMVVYLSISLSVSSLTGWYDRRNRRTSL